MRRAATVAVALGASAAVAQLLPDHEFLPMKEARADLEALDRSCKGSVPCGMPGIWQCSKPGQIAITFDDGPFEFTKLIQKQFDDYGYNATFFITGKNRGRQIDDHNTEYPMLIRGMIRQGHQVASHTWTHRNLDHGTYDWDIWSEMLDNENALAKILDGYVPAYMRPPYAVCGERCGSVLNDLGYKVIMFNIDTTDYKYNDEKAIEKAIVKFNAALQSNGTGSYIVLSHDQEWTAKKLVPVMLKQVQEKGYEAVTVGECLGDPVENWYRQASLSELKPTVGPDGPEAQPKTSRMLRKYPGDEQANVHLPEPIERLIELNDRVDRARGKQADTWTPPGDQQKWKASQGPRKPNFPKDIQRRQKMTPFSEIQRNGRKALEDMNRLTIAEMDAITNIAIPPEVEYSRWYSKQVDRMLKPDRKEDLKEKRPELWTRADVDKDRLAWIDEMKDRMGRTIRLPPEHARHQKWLDSAEHGDYDLYTEAPRPDWPYPDEGQAKRKREEREPCPSPAPGHGEGKPKHPDSWHDWH